MRSTNTNDAPRPSLLQVFLAFLTIGATSFGGGVVAHLRNAVVGKHQWIDDATFVEFLTISQTLPGLNTVNMAMLMGDRLAGARGAVAALVGLSLPAASLMFAVGMMYQSERRRPLVEAALHGVAPAAVGLLLATTLKLARTSLSRAGDVVFVVVTVLAVNRLKLSVPYVLIALGLLATLWYRIARRQST